MVAVPAATPVTSKPPSAPTATVAIVSSLDVAVVALTTSAASVPPAGSVATVTFLVAPTAWLKVF